METIPDFSNEEQDKKDSNHESREQDEHILKIPDIGDIKYEESTVEFSEKYKEKTGGVEGYVRRQVTWSELFNSITSIIDLNEINKLQNTYNEIIPHLAKNISHTNESSRENIQDLQNILTSLDWIFKREIKHPLRGQKARNFEERQQFKDQLGEKKFREHEDKIPKARRLAQEVINRLGDNFFHKMNIHLMNGVWSFDEEESKAFENKLMLQMVFSPELHKGLYRVGYEFVSSDTQQLIPDSQIVSIRKDNWVDEEERLLKGDEIASNLRESGHTLILNSGLSVSSKGFWSADHDREEMNNLSTPFWGFSRKNMAYKNYLRSSKDFFEGVLSSKGELESNDLYRYSDRFHKRIERKIAVIDHLLTKEESASSRYSAGISENPHPVIPVVIGHPDIPDLRWCHASYGYVPTKNGISILEFQSKDTEKS